MKCMDVVRDMEKYLNIVNVVICLLYQHSGLTHTLPTVPVLRTVKQTHTLPTVPALRTVKQTHTLPTVPVLRTDTHSAYCTSAPDC
jgi:hypothetical protein